MIDGKRKSVINKATIIDITNAAPHSCFNCRRQTVLYDCTRAGVWCRRLAQNLCLSCLKKHAMNEHNEIRKARGL